MSPPGSSLRAPLLWLLLPFMAGIATAGAGPARLGGWIPVLAAVAAAIAGLASWLALRPFRTARGGGMACLVAAGFLGGFVWLSVRTPPAAAWRQAPREVNVSLEIEQVFPSSPVRKTINGFGRIVSSQAPVAEVAGLRVYFSAVRKIGVLPQKTGRYLVRGVLENRTPGVPPSGFDRYLDSLGIGLTLTRVQVMREERAPGWFARFCARTEARMEGILRHGIERHADVCAIYLGMMLGEKAVLDAEQQAAFMRSGTFHIFVIAGLHTGVIAAAIGSLLLLVRIPRRLAAVTGLALLWLYVQVAGAGLPARRAFLMIAFLLGGRLLRKPVNALAALTAAGLVFLLLDPQQLFSAGFQMSFAVVTSLVAMGGPLAASWLAAWQPWRDLPEAGWSHAQRTVRFCGRKVLGAAAISWGAFVATAPSSIGYFGLLSPGSLLANLAVVPLASLAISAGTASLFAGFAHFPAASALFNHAAAVLIKTMAWLVVQGARLPGVYFPAEYDRPWMASAGLALVVAAILTGASLGWRRSAGGYLLPVLALVLVLFFGVKFV